MNIRAWVLLGTAVGLIITGGSVFSATQGVSEGTGLYWAVATASTVGYGDVVPKDAIGQLIAVCMMLTTIPVLAAVFSLLTGIHLKRHVNAHLDTHLERVKEQLERHHERMQNHLETRLAEHQEETKQLIQGNS